jgi:hypothetical protein
LDVDSGEWRIGAMTFGATGESKPYFQLNSFTTTDDVLKAVDGVDKMDVAGDPDNDDAFDFVNQNMFTPENGDRPYAQNFVVLVTDDDTYLAAPDNYKPDKNYDLLGTEVYTQGEDFADTFDVGEIKDKPVDDFLAIVPNQDNFDSAGLYVARLEEIRTTPSTTTEETTTLPLVIIDSTTTLAPTTAPTTTESMYSNISWHFPPIIFIPHSMFVDIDQPIFKRKLKKQKNFKSINSYEI